MDELWLDQNEFPRNPSLSLILDDSMVRVSVADDEVGGQIYLDKVEIKQVRDWLTEALKLL